MGWVKDKGTSPATQGGGGRYEKGGKVTEGAGKHMPKDIQGKFTREQIEEMYKILEKRKYHPPPKARRRRPEGVKKGLQEELKKKIIMKPPAKKAK